MRWFITFLLLLVAGLGVAWLVFEERLLPSRQVSTASPVLARLAELTEAKAFRKITLTLPGQPVLTLTRNPDGSWSQPGNWPLRVSEVEVLVNALSGLKSRFAPVAYTPEQSEVFGLGENKLGITVDVQNDSVTRTVNLTFGQAKLTGDMTEFTRPCYVLIDDFSEVVQLGPKSIRCLLVRRKSTAVGNYSLTSNGSNSLPTTSTPQRLQPVGRRY